VLYRLKAVLELPAGGQILQSIIVLLSLVVMGVAPPPEAAADDGYTNAALLAVGGNPPLFLAAFEVSQTRFDLRVLNASSEVVAEERLEFDGVDKAPRFSAPVLRKLDPAIQLTKDHKLSVMRSKAEDPEGRGLVLRLLQPERTEFVLMTADKEQPILEVPRAGDHTIYSYFETSGQRLVLAGWMDVDGNGEVPQQGVFMLIPMPTKARKLRDSRVEEGLSREAELLVLEKRYLAAAKVLKRLGRRRKAPRTYYLSALCMAYAQRWQDAVDSLARLKEGGDKGIALHAQAARNPLVRESMLRQIDINGGSDYTFKASKGYEGTSVWVKIKDPSGKNVAVFKPTNGNTYHRGEVFTYQMAKIMGLEELYPVTLLHTLDTDGCRKFTAALEKVKYKGMKEKNRKRLIRKCEKGELEGAVKEWVRDFIFFQAIGKAEKLKKHSIFRHLRKDKAHPEKGKTLKVKTVSRLYKPDHCKKATYRGRMDRARLAQDLSDIMVMDVLNSNEDRFPGANIEFKSVNGAKESKKCVFRFGESRLFSLDNGATFKGTASNAHADFKKRLKPTRFSRETFARLKALDAFVRGEGDAPDILKAWKLSTSAELSVFLALDKGDSHKRRKEPFKLFTYNLKFVLKRMSAYEKNKHAWFR